MTSRLDQLAERFRIGIDVLEHLIARIAPGPQPAIERTDIAVAERRKALCARRDQTLTVIIEHNRNVLARQSHLGLNRDPVRGHVGREQRMAGGEGGLVSEIEQRDLLAQQQRAADVGGGDGRKLHGVNLERTGHGLLNDRRRVG